VSFLGPVALT